MHRTSRRIRGLMAAGALLTASLAVSGCGLGSMGISKDEATAAAMGDLKTEVQQHSKTIAYAAADAPNFAKAKKELRRVGNVIDATGNTTRITVGTFSDALAGSSDMWSEGRVYLRTCYTVTLNVETGVDVDKPPAPALLGVPCSAEIRRAAGDQTTFVDLPADW